VKVALFHSTLPEPTRKVGGVEVFVHRLGNRLTDRGHSVTVYTFGPSPEDARYEVVSAGPAWLGARRVARLTIAPAVLNCIEQRRHDVLHLHGDDWFFLWRRIPTVRTLHGSALFEARAATSIRRRVVQSAFYPLEVLASRLATLSFDTGSALPGGYRTNGSLTLAIEQTEHDEKAPRSARPTILFVGTWEGRKRGAFLAEQFVHNVLPLHPDAELVMVSDRCVQTPGVRWVRFPSDAELSALYRSAWIFCMPSTYEGFGMPYLEAMAHGLPVVASPNPGACHVIGDAAGCVIGDEDLAPTLARLLADPERRIGLSAAGHHRAAAFSWDRVLAEHEAAYSQVIARHHKRRPKLRR
jgi:phosphatidylinositol alpha-mannosyltransferase